MVAPGEIGAANGSGKKNIAHEGQPILLVHEHDRAGRVAWAMHHTHLLLAHAHRIAIVEPTIGHKRLGSGHAEHGALGGQLRDPEIIVRMRPFDGNTETLGQLTGLAAVPDGDKLVALVGEADEILSERKLK